MDATNQENTGRRDPAETDRIKAEISRIEAETHKLQLETAEFEKKINSPWYRKEKFYQILVAGVLAIPLIWFYVKEFAIPFIQAENIKLSLQNEETRQELNALKNDYEEKLQNLRIEKENQRLDYLAQLKDIKAQYKNLDSTRQALAAQFGELSNLYEITKSKRDEFKSKSDQLNRQIYEKDKLIANFDKKIKQVEQEQILKTVNPYFKEILASLKHSEIDFLYIPPKKTTSSLKIEITNAQTYKSRIFQAKGGSSDLVDYKLEKDEPLSFEWDQANQSFLLIISTDYELNNGKNDAQVSYVFTNGDNKQIFQKKNRYKKYKQRRCAG